MGTGPKRRLVVEADGGARGNPGPAAYGALVRDAATGAVLAEAAESIGVATNNVAEYHGLIAGLRLVRELTPGASGDTSVEVRMDSMLVIEQMAGRWKIKHADMRRLAIEARQLVPPDTTWTYVPRERNKAADALLNRVLDGGGPVWSVARAGAAAQKEAPAVGWAEVSGTATTVLLLRHGATARSVAKQFSGSGGDDPPLTDDGRGQAEDAAASLRARGGIAAVVSSPMRRTRETAEIVAQLLGVQLAVEPDFAETAFGAWDGHTFAEVRERWPDELAAWLASTSASPPGGESFDRVLHRVGAARDRLLQSYAGQTVVVATHVTPIKLLI
ncbi:MAG TPA: bifunctional RNase H/acid phosphatase, partial [Actinopolymorphaceae bacterium]|nr:bifunctional RNase H/acid phosphatase [Actinopolymorphaceae bacterium]